MAHEVRKLGTPVLHSPDIYLKRQKTTPQNEINVRSVEYKQEQTYSKLYRGVN